MTTLGPVSAALVEELQGLARRHGLVLWLDNDAQYTDFADRLIAERAAGRLPFAVLGHRGSHLELMRALEPLTQGLDLPALVVHLPGFNDERLRRSPLLELSQMGMRHRRRLETLLSDAAAGKVQPEALSARLSRPLGSLAEADGWLSAQLAARGDDGLGRVFRDTGLPALIDALLDDLGDAQGPLADALRGAAAPEALWVALNERVGLTEAWRGTVSVRSESWRADAAFILASWALTVEYVADLGRAPLDPRLVGLRALPRAIVEACGGLAAHLRAARRTFYKRAADDTQAAMPIEVKAAAADDLGRIDTFLFEEDVVLRAAIQALADEDWRRPAEWAKARAAGGSFWLAEQPSRVSAWELVRAAVRLGEALTTAGPTLSAKDHREAVARYEKVGADVDQAHRQLEQRRMTQLYPEVPEAEALRARLDALRANWLAWADQWAADYAALCAELGALPPAELLQRGIFDELVRPRSDETGAVAFVMVDALRFELGRELIGLLGDGGATSVSLSARLAELPTVTEVGMNVLAAVSRDGRLQISLREGEICGFSTGEHLVSDPASRHRAIGARAGDPASKAYSLEQLGHVDLASLQREIKRAQVVVLNSVELDTAGENNLWHTSFDLILRRLAAALRKLREAGVRRFVITADHGFLLLNDATVRRQPRGDRRGPSRRHALHQAAVDHRGEARVPLAALGYDGADGWQLSSPTSTAVFDTGRRPMGFVHGGNSLQERVIPVISISHRSPPGRAGLRYVATLEPCPPESGLLCVAVRIEIEQHAGLSFTGKREVELSLVVAEEDGEGTAAVELVGLRGRGHVEAGVISAQVGQRVEVLFRLFGPNEARLRLMLAPIDTALMAPVRSVERYPVHLRGGVPAPAPAPGATPAPIPSVAWLDDLPVEHQPVLRHLQVHGSITEAEATRLLGGARGYRRLLAALDRYNAVAPFTITTEASDSGARLIREGQR